MQTKKRDPEATRNAILDAAEALFLEQGFAEASISEISKLASVTKSLIHHHFGSKEELWTAVMRRFFGEYFEGQKAMLLAREPSLELLRDSIITYFRYLQHKPNFARMNSWMTLVDDDSCRDMDGEIVALGVAKIKETQARGLIREDISADSILISFLSLVENWFLGRRRFRHSHFSNWVQEDKESPLFDEAYLNDMLRIFFEGVAPRSDGGSTKQSSAPSTEDPIP